MIWTHKHGETCLNQTEGDDKGIAARSCPLCLSSQSIWLSEQVWVLKHARGQRRFFPHHRPMETHCSNTTCCCGSSLLVPTIHRLVISGRCGIQCQAPRMTTQRGCDSHKRSDRWIPAALSGCRAGEEYMLRLCNELLSAPGVTVSGATELTRGSAKVTQNCRLHPSAGSLHVASASSTAGAAQLRVPDALDGGRRVMGGPLSAGARKKEAMFCLADSRGTKLAGNSQAPVPRRGIARVARLAQIIALPSSFLLPSSILPPPPSFLPPRSIPSPPLVRHPPCPLDPPTNHSTPRDRRQASEGNSGNGRESCRPRLRPRPRSALTPIP